jgi:C_GCAxxG_C_C family probable redox protein
MSKKVIRAGEIFDSGFNCAQAVLSTFSSDFGLDEREALRVAGAFGAGMGRMGRVCGAVSGALMTIGLVASKTRDGEDDEKEAGFGLAREFTRRFEAAHGSIDCRALIGVSLLTEAGRAEADEKGLFESRCRPLVEDAVRILEEILT